MQALETANLKPDDRVLVHAGAGGVGAYAVQLAKVYWNAYVVATAGPHNQSFLTKVHQFAAMAAMAVAYVCLWPL